MLKLFSDFMTWLANPYPDTPPLIEQIRRRHFPKNEKVQQVANVSSEELQQQVKILYGILYFVIVAVIIVFVSCAYRFQWDWTGFGETQVITTSIKEDHQTNISRQDHSGKTLWDWLELLIVPILIAVLGVMFQQNQLRSKTRTDYIKRLGMSYREVKAARRALRAAGLTTKFGSRPKTLSKAEIDAYKQEMQHLNYAQLELEALKIEAKHLPVFASINQLAGYLRKMEDYLREILKEHEKTSIILDSGTSIDWHELNFLKEFTESGGDKTKRFHTEFSNPYDCAIKQISQNLINY